MIDLNKKTVTLKNAFKLKCFDEALPAGRYVIETNGCGSGHGSVTDKYIRSLILHLSPCAANPGLKRTLLVPFADLEDVLLKDQMTPKKSEDPFLEEMMADPFIHLIMQADGYSETEVRNLHSAL